ncbi:hemolysin family protein [Singulisphaera acidiphila]|uniref:CBS domain-containing protein n=1 Tax=Singulisphaera acidiphila (strain ATCC BAA-1392 / DSM 18658 / VKM B-2454 / MOB10) TaxID=886293 RepID=L0DPW6_SINAD|nr:hemolysin family protein [Singulisphaera acidiphila]AGA30878.1 CBS domain-containing protein [Singulisphaera acidiphila DSM 18658]
MGGLNLGWTLLLGFFVLSLHLLSVTLARALRTYSPSRLEELCAERGLAALADDVADFDERTERSAETLAVVTGLMLAALLGATSGQVAPSMAVEAVFAIALSVGAAGYVLAGVVGRVFAEAVIVKLWPFAGALRTLTGPLTFGSRMVETLAFRLANSADTAPRPASVEVEIPADSEHHDGSEPDLPELAHELLHNVVELTRRDVSEIMTPRSSMVALPSSITARGAAQVFRESGRSRIPVFGENRDDILGILYAKDLFPIMTDGRDPEKIVARKLVRPAYCVPETKNALELLEEFRSRRIQLAIVLDEYGGVAGLVTLEDLLEQLVGAIDDEHDVPTLIDPVRPLGGTKYEVVATITLELLNERLGLHLPTDADFLTLGGLAFHALGRLPEPGASFRYDGVEFTVVEVADHSIRRLRLDLQPAATVGT